MLDKDLLGRRGEQLAADHLIAAGYRILDRNWRCPGGELDIVALDGDELVMVEVKTRRGLGFGHPFEGVKPDKLARIWRLAAAWRKAHGQPSGRATRVDVIGILVSRDHPPVLEHLRAVV